MMIPWTGPAARAGTLPPLLVWSGLAAGAPAQVGFARGYATDTAFNAAAFNAPAASFATYEPYAGVFDAPEQDLVYLLGVETFRGSAAP